VCIQSKAILPILAALVYLKLLFITIKQQWMVEMPVKRTKSSNLYFDPSSLLLIQFVELQVE
jgi:hypothetical protein